MVNQLQTQKSIFLDCGLYLIANPSLPADLNMPRFWLDFWRHWQK